MRGLSLTTPPPSLHLSLPESAAGIRETLKHMRTLVDQGKDDMAVRHLANQIVGHLPGKAWTGQMRAVFNWVRWHIRYTLDTNGTEVIQSAAVTLRLRYGDCDDFCVLLATLLEQLGYACAFCAMGFGPPGQYAHVTVLAELPGEVDPVSLDATENEPMGWFPPGVTCLLICPISAESSYAA